MTSGNKDVIGYVLDFGLESKIDSQNNKINQSSQWKSSDISFVKSQTNKPVVVKGIMSVEDALIAVKLGADAIWISNNGGRQMDTLPSTISVLKSISQAVNKTTPKVEIYIDSGIRRGTDVAKCLALGASMCFIGRPVAWGLHFAGKEGVEQMLNTLHEEFKIVMVLTDSMEVSKITEK